MKILSSFTHPHVVPNLYAFICSAEHRKIFWKNVLIKQISIPIDYHSVYFFLLYGSQWGLRSVWLLAMSQPSWLCHSNIQGCSQLRKIRLDLANLVVCMETTERVCSF